MKPFRLWILVASTTILIPLTAHADFFELKLKATCFDPNTSKFTVQKTKLSGSALVAKLLNITPEEAAAFAFSYGAVDSSINIALRCNGNPDRSLAKNGTCKSIQETGDDPVKFAKVCRADLFDFTGVVVEGSVLCTSQGKTDSGLGPIAAKGTCVGNFVTNTMEICRLDGTIGKRFVPKGPCVN